MNLPCRIRAKAIQDLEDIWLYTFETWSKSQADQYYNLIMAKIEAIATAQMKGTPVEYIKSGYWRIGVKSHIIFYKHADDGIIEIIRILHKKMDVENRLKKDY
jgi:toxin ParE1/3/4